MICALVAGQLGLAAPVQAAELIAAERLGGQQLGAFAGVRLRVPLDAERHERANMTLTAAPTLHVQQADGARRTRMGEGFELGRREGRFGLSYAGQPVSRLVGGASGPEGERRNISALGWVAIGVGALALVYVAAIGVCTEVTECFPDE